MIKINFILQPVNSVERAMCEISLHRNVAELYDLKTVIAASGSPIYIGGVLTAAEIGEYFTALVDRTFELSSKLHWKFAYLSDLLGSKKVKHYYICKAAAEKYGGVKSDREFLKSEQYCPECAVHHTMRATTQIYVRDYLYGVEESGGFAEALPTWLYDWISKDEGVAKYAPDVLKLYTSM